MKVCSKCKYDYPVPLEDHFSKNKTKKDGFSSYCKVCSRINSAKHYSNNKPSYSEDRATRRVILRQFAYDFLKQHPCIDCGEKDPIVLEFDHVSGIKINNIGTMIHEVVSLDKLKAEVEKCVIRCSNCHKRKTAKDFEWYKTIKTE